MITVEIDFEIFNEASKWEAKVREWLWPLY